jgi:Ser/Thr protein kinase RdoA (MazF antagonist)
MDPIVATSDRSVIASALRRLGWTTSTNGFEFERLAGGRSGSSVWRLTLDEWALVLKVTSAASDRALLAHAEREVDFYRDLAHQIPLRVPTCLRQVRDDEGVALLLVAESPAPPVDTWTDRDFQQVARDLGMLHGFFQGETATHRLPGWLQQPSSVSLHQAGAAAARWRELVVPTGFERRRAMMLRLVSQVPALEHQFSCLPPSLCHGDAHRDNLLQTQAGEWVWADWQGVRIGQGVDDLAFFWQRAFTERESIPSPVGLLSSYREGLGRTGTTAATDEELTQALLWSELRMWAIDWPPYLGWLAPMVLERVLGRCERLVGLLDIYVGAG